MVDVTGKQTQQLAQGVTQAGVGLSAIAKVEADKANQLRVDDALNQAVKARTDTQVDALQLRGKNAMERPDNKALPDEFDEKLEKNIAAIEGGLGNETQKQLFRRSANQLRQQMYGSLSSHMMGEQKALRQETWSAKISTATNQANLLWGDEAIRNQSTEAIHAAVGEMAKDQGWDAEITKSKLTEAMSPMHAGVISGMVDGHREDLARDYYEKNVDTMSVPVRAKAMSMIEAGDFESRAQSNAEKFFKVAGGDPAKALNLIREKLSGKDEDAAAAYVKTWDAEKTALRERAQRDAADSAWKYVSQGKKPPPSLMSALDGRDAIAITKQLTEGSPVKTDMSKWLDFTNKTPSQLAEMDQNTLMRDYRSVFSDSDMRNANDMILASKGLNGKGKPHAEGLQLITTADMMKRSAREMGVLPTGNKLTPEQDAAFLTFTEKMQTKVNTWESANGKKASPEVLSSLLNEEKVNKVRLDVWGTDPEKSVISLSSDEIGKAYITVGKREIKLSAIPVDYRANAIRRIQSKGMAVTEQLIASMWVADNPKK